MAQDVLLDHMEAVPLGKLKQYRNNPRKGNVAAIAESLKENGQFRPLIVQRSTGEILGGNHTYLGAKELGWKTIKVVYVDVDDERAKKIVLADNRTSDLATYDNEILADILASLDTPDVGTGYTPSEVTDLLEVMNQTTTAAVEEINAMSTPATGYSLDDEDIRRAPDEVPDDDEYDFSPEGTFDQKVEAEKQKALDGGGYLAEQYQSEETPISQEDVQMAEMQRRLEAHAEEHVFPIKNYWGIPTLRREMLLELPDKVDTWGGKDATPDDGETNWLWNVHSPASGLPWNRAIISFFTYDDKMMPWFAKPEYYISKAYVRGARMAITPDTSFWIKDPRACHLQNLYDAQWLACFMQDAGLKVMPRIQFTDIESVKYGILGIPKNAPCVAFCTQNVADKEFEKYGYHQAMRLAVEQTQPQKLLVYSGPPGRRMVEAAGLPKSLPIVFVENYVAKRRGVAFDNPDGAKKLDKSKGKPRPDDDERQPEEDW